MSICVNHRLTNSVLAGWVQFDSFLLMSPKSLYVSIFFLQVQIKILLRYRYLKEMSNGAYVSSCYPSSGGILNNSSFANQSKVTQNQRLDIFKHVIVVCPYAWITWPLMPWLNRFKQQIIRSVEDWFSVVLAYHLLIQTYLATNALTSLLVVCKSHVLGPFVILFVVCKSFVMGLFVVVFFVVVALVVS